MEARVEICVSVVASRFFGGASRTSASPELGDYFTKGAYGVEG